MMILKILKTWLSNQRMQSLFVHATRMNLVTSRHAIVSWEALQFSLSLSPDTKRQLCMQVWILDETSDGDSNIYVHHEVPLSAFPLCTAWLDCPLKGGEKGMIAYTLCWELVFLADSSFSIIFPFSRLTSIF